MKYTAVIASMGLPLESIEADSLKEIIGLIDSAGMSLYEYGHRDMEVTFECFPEEDLDSILNLRFPWEQL